MFNKILHIVTVAAGAAVALATAGTVPAVVGTVGAFVGMLASYLAKSPVNHP